MSAPTQTVDPRQICCAVPCKTGLVDVLCTNGLCNVIGTGRLANQPLFQYGGSDVRAVRNQIAHQFLHGTECEWLMLIDDDIGFTVTDWDMLWEGDELAVCAEYLQKIDGRQVPARFGLGFARVHRSVFERLMDVTAEDGTPWVSQGIYAGQLVHDFHPTGVTPAGDYRGEDHGFWMLVRLADVPVRVETRTRLKHSGRSTWVYDASALEIADSGAQ